MKIGNLNIRIGADPEVFVTDKQGKFVCAHNMVEGTKENPFKVENGAVQVDGMALEFNIDPADSAEEFQANIGSVMKQLAAMVPEYNLNAVPVAEFGKELMDAAPMEAKEMGCDPDLDAWNEGRENPKPNGEVDFRTAAGHIHIGWTEGMDINDPGHVEACIMLVKQLDFYLGIPSVIIDDCTKRRELYGKAGAFRVKPYGVEYRVLSNFWLKSAELTDWAYRNTCKAVSELLKGTYQGDSFTRNLINEGDVNWAKECVRDYGLDMPKIVRKSVKPKIATGCNAYDNHAFNNFFGEDNVRRA